MESANAGYVVDRVDADVYEPDVIAWNAGGKFHQIQPAGGAADKLDACLWRSDPATYDYLFEGDEAFLVVEGAATVELRDTDDRIELRAGDVAYFKAGTRSIWTITQPFKKFTVIANQA